MKHPQPLLGSLFLFVPKPAQTGTAGIQPSNILAAFLLNTGFHICLICPCTRLTRSTFIKKKKARCEGIISDSLVLLHAHNDSKV